MNQSEAMSSSRVMHQVICNKFSHRAICKTPIISQFDYFYLSHLSQHENLHFFFFSRSMFLDLFRNGGKSY